MTNPDASDRRLDEMEKRLERVESPDPPEFLLAAIQEEIPQDLGAREDAPPSSAPTWPWRKLAASVAVVAVGGMLGYAVLRQAPTPGEVVTTRVVNPPRSYPPMAAQTEIGDAQPVPADPNDIARTEHSAAREGAQAQDPFADPRVLRSGPVPSSKDETSRQSAEGDQGSSTSDRRASLNKNRRVLVDRTNVGGNEAGQQSRFLEGSASNQAIEKENVAVGELRAQQQALERQLDSLYAGDQPAPMSPEPAAELPKPKAAKKPVEDSIIVTSEAPMLDPNRIMQGTPISEIELEEIPEARDPWATLNQTPGEMVDRVSAAQEPQNRSADLQERMRALGERFPAAPSAGGTDEPNDQPYGDMFFEAYGTNPFVDTEDDAQSTFGIDVDTASYTMARSYLRRGHLPPRDAIRVEEFINYFNYGDPAPRRKDFAVVVEGAPSPFASTARTHLLRFALKGREIAPAQRKPAVLTFVVDVSGSMNRENRLGLVKRALRLLVDQLDSNDAVGLVVYGSSGRVLLEPTSDHRRVLMAIERLRSGGSTNAEEGLVLGYRMARRYFQEGAINRVVLCSDGVANVGRTGPDSILGRIESEAEGGVELTTVGFGMGNYNDVLMEQLANKGDGNYAYVDDLEAARRVFVENLTGTLQTIAGDAKIQVEFDPQVVQSYRLLGYENRDIADRDFRNDAIDAGEIGGGHQVTALYEIKLRPDAPNRGKVATLRLRYMSKRSERVVEDAVDLMRSDLAATWRGASFGLQLAATAAEFAEMLKGSYWAREGDLNALAQRAGSLARDERPHGESGESAELAELAELIGRAASLRGVGPESGEDGIER